MLVCNSKQTLDDQTTQFNSKRPPGLYTAGFSLYLLLNAIYRASPTSFLDQNKKRLRSHHCLRSASQLQWYLGSVQLRSMPQAHFCTPGPEPPQ